MSSSTAIQFDEATLTAPSQDRRQRTTSIGTGNSSSRGNSAHPSTTPPTPFKGGVGMAKQNSRSTIVSHLGLDNAPAGSGFASTSAAPSPSSRRSGKKDKRTVVTTPAWAQHEHSSPPQTPTLGGEALPSTSTTPGGTNSPILTGARSPTSASGWQSPRSTHYAKSKSAIQREEEAAISSGTSGVAHDQDHARFWTFTLPVKYRNRLHAYPFKRTRTDTGNTDGGAQNQSGDRDAEAGHDRAADSESRAEAGSSDGEDEEMIHSSSSPMQDRGDEKRLRQMEKLRRDSSEGLGHVHASAEAAAGLGGQDSLVSWRRRQQVGTPTVAQSPVQETSGDNYTNGNGRPEPWGRPQHANSWDVESAEGRKGGSEELTQGNEQGDEMPTKGGPENQMRIMMPPRSDRSFTRRQDPIPGWDSPWRPEEMHGLGAIDVGGYTFTGGDDFYPRTNTRYDRKSSKKVYSSTAMFALRKSKKGRGGRSSGAMDAEGFPRSRHSASSPEGKKENTQGPGPRQLWLMDKWELWQEFLMKNPFVPLLFRAINFSFTTATLAIAIRLHIVLRNQGSRDAVGASPIVAIIFAPLSLIHVASQVWLEYFSRPIGLWAVKSKLSYQLIELVFISLWSALLALTFDNYGTSSLNCVSWYAVASVSASCVTNENGEGGPLRDPSAQPTVCGYQAALIGLTFTTLVAYTSVFAVSLFRTVVR